MMLRSALRGRPQTEKTQVKTERRRERERLGHRAAGACLALFTAVLLCGSSARAQSVAFVNPGKSDEIY